MSPLIVGDRPGDIQSRSRGTENFGAAIKRGRPNLASGNSVQPGNGIGSFRSKPEGESGCGQNAGITGAGTTCSSTPRTPGIVSAATRSACLFSPGSSSEIQK